MSTEQEKRCKYGDPFCPCQDGDICHYEGKDPMAPLAGAQGETRAEECPNCGSMFDSENGQAEEIARLRDWLEKREKHCGDAAVVIERHSSALTAAESQVQALQAQLAEAQQMYEGCNIASQRHLTEAADRIREAEQRIETLTAERDEAVAAEREACARVADDSLEDEKYGHAAFRCMLIARRIRARGVPAAPQEGQP